MLNTAIEITSSADLLLIIGTSMQVYPAASLIHYITETTPVFFIDPKPSRFMVLKEPLSTEMIPHGPRLFWVRLMPVGGLKPAIHPVPALPP